MLYDAWTSILLSITDSLTIEHQDGGWSKWSDWSECSAECDGGMQWRNRSCDSPPPIGSGKDCTDHPIEGKQCNTHSCFGEWGCWSEFSSCSATCGTGIRSRVRQCLSQGPNQRIAKGCVGNSSDIQTCRNSPCNDTLLPGIWSDWTDCSQDNVQYRHRICYDDLPCDQVIQLQHCTQDFVTSDADVGSVSSASAGQKLTRRLGGVYLVVVAVIAFIIGGVASVGLYMYIQRYKEQKHREEELWKNSKNEMHQKGSNATNSSQISLDFQNLSAALSANNRLSVNAFGTLQKDKMTVSEASNTLKRNSMWTNLSITDL